MDMKNLILLLLLPSLATANQGTNAFITGFANAVNRAMGGEPEKDVMPQQQQNVYVEEKARFTPVNQDGTFSGYSFSNRVDCDYFVTNNNSKYMYCQKD